MAEGFVPDESQGWRKVGTWISGTPRKSMWTGLSFARAQKLPIQTLRCTRCGFLESYAND